MMLPDLNRRNFIKVSTMSIAGGMAASATGTPAVDPAEVSEWKSLEGSRVLVGEVEMLLKQVDVTDYLSDSARPKNIRSYCISLLFVYQGSTLTLNDREMIRHRTGACELTLSEIVPPQGETSQYFEGILN